MKRGSLIFILIFLFFCGKAQNIVINEFMSANHNFFYDEDNESSDWIELYNRTNTPVPLVSYCLTDNINDMYKWCFPDTVIIPAGFMVVFASGKDRSVSGEELHTGFSINSTGETLYVTQNGSIIHQMPPVDMFSNYSFGLFPDGSDTLALFQASSPGAPNSPGLPPPASMFSHQGRMYDDFFTLSLNTAGYEGEIRYTTDGSVPNDQSMLYVEPLQLDQSHTSPVVMCQILMSPPENQFVPVDHKNNAIVISAAVFDFMGRQLNHTETHTYLFRHLGHDHGNLPVISLTASPEDLFSDTTGIFVPGIHFVDEDPDWTGNYYMRGREWERSARMEFFEPGDSCRIRQTVGLRTHGGNMRRFQQKGLRIYARDEYGKSSINHELFPERLQQEYKRFILRPFMSSWTESGIEDHLALEIAKNLKFETPASRPVIVYINGEYRGIYFMQERRDEHFFKHYHSLHKDSIDVIENWADHSLIGDNTEFNELYRFIENNDLRVSVNYEYVKSLIDIGNFIDYQIYEIFIANYDWPANNVLCWRSGEKGSKWRWVLFDCDGALNNVSFQGLKHALSDEIQDYPTNAKSTLFFRKLMQNSEFSTQFFERFQYLLNTELLYKRTDQVLQNLILQMMDEIESQSELFDHPSSFQSWFSGVVEIQDFLMLRACTIHEQVRNDFKFKMIIPDCTAQGIQVSELNVFPNPGNGEFEYAFKVNSGGKAQVFLLNMSGQTVYSDQILMVPGMNSFKSGDIAISPGVYLLSIFSGKEYFSAKVIVY